MILTPEQQAGWEAELAIYNADITRANVSIAEHNALPGASQVDLRELLTLDQYIQLKLDEIAQQGANKARAESKTNLQLQTEWDAMALQLIGLSDIRTLHLGIVMLRSLQASPEIRMGLQNCQMVNF
jgi:hypothetical protein